ncbi:MucB/RseB C-terminal domain-containing protein [Porticoccus sp. W117]|uniref:MucB/RseB C-terminal domain-containing protein n=1 Tax=Porticoccus sp. W117 TaxID=3054777 RepID=UPI0025989FDC|nr:MucB/RseB C-terminal domain-containing protein [Porticoccus sp. W117]MDM3869829.1 MucB/RseB C-terminal domain-containing protein [Porticoccus sp. W117]
MQLFSYRCPQITRLLPVLICGFFTFLSLPAVAADDSAQKDVAAQQMLARLWQSSRQTNYQGVFTYQQGSQLDSFRVTHWVEDGKEFESLSRLDGNEQVFIRPGNPLHCKRMGETLLAQSEQMESLYKVIHQGQERVAGRIADKLRLQPRDFARNGYRLWLDSDTGLVLKAEVFSRHKGGSLLERFQFIDLSIGSDFSPLPDSEQSGVERLPVDLLPCDGEQTIDLGRWQIDQPPKGFVLSNVRQQEGGEKLLYSDGMASFSVFIEPAQKATADCHGFRGATVLCVSYLRDSQQRLYSVSVVGEIPMPLAKRLVRSVSEVAP